jgi:plastocyanin
MYNVRHSRIADLAATLRRRRSVRAVNAWLRSRPVRRAAPLRTLSAGAALALVVAACSSAVSAGAPGSNFPTAAPPSEPAMMDMSPPAMMDMSPSATAQPPSATPEASDSAPGAPSVAPVAPSSSAATGATLHISAQNIQFDTDHLQAPAGQRFVLDFDNKDPGIPHNIEIKDSSGASVFRGQIITGPAEAMYQVPALAAGSYMFACDVHPTMTGILTVI